VALALQRSVENSPIWVTFIGATVRYRRTTYAYGKTLPSKKNILLKGKNYFTQGKVKKDFNPIEKKMFSYREEECSIPIKENILL